MLSKHNVERINNRIAALLRDNERAFISAEDRAANLKEIESLTAVLNPQPTRDETLRDLAAALLQTENRSPLAHHEIIDRLFKFDARKQF
jgi:hypothetical protein